MSEKSCVSALILLLLAGSALAQEVPLTDQEQLGKFLFTDTNLSTPEGQSCQSCHDPAVAFTEPDKDRGVSEGVIPGRFGSRNAPSAMYQAFAPNFALVDGEFAGGQFWDQRAANLTEQAKGPFLNPLEMNNSDAATVLNKIQTSAYAPLFNQVCGNKSYPEGQYTCMASAIAAYETTPELNRFSSKFDLYPELMTVQEKRGLLLFRGKGNCAICHLIAPIPSKSLFTDMDAHNTGVPGNLGMMGNTSNLTHYFPFYYMAEFNPEGLNFVDIGLAGNPSVPVVTRPAVKGAMKAPTLRNVELTAPYMHNGVFRTLKEVVHFYNTRDILGNCAIVQAPQPGVNCWPAPEVLVNIEGNLGNLELTDAEENEIVAFLKTLTDGYVPQPQPGITAQEELGKLLFTDINLSTPAGQSCQSCHDPAVAFTEPDKDRGVSEGATPGRFGSRNAPSTMYAAFSPDFVLFGDVFIGGQFWDQRASNLTEQAKGPFLNPLEMNNTDEAEVLNKINNSNYAPLFNQVCGASPDQYTCMAEAIAAFENTSEMNRFSSKFDLDQANMTAQEIRGFNLFNGKGRCAVCHPVGPTPSSTLFTDFDAENIGVPGNLRMLGNTSNLTHYFPFYYSSFNPAGLNFVDTGVAGNPHVPGIMQPDVKGAMKAPTLRNVELTAPYMHNGVFRTLKEVVHFYNTRDILGDCAVNQASQPGVNCWPAPEVLENMNTIIGNLQLTDAEENEIVAFLHTLTDGYIPSNRTSALTDQERLGKNLFTDTNLSMPPGQGCISCHDPAFAFTDPEKDRGVSGGINTSRFGSRNAPSAMYAAFAPDFGLPDAKPLGGQFWDQRASNLTEQAKGPFLNPLEMNNSDATTVLNKIQASAYAPLFNQVCGNKSYPEGQYTCMASAIAAFENTPELNRFNSKFDIDRANLTVQEMRGFNLFNGKGKCAICHPIGPFGLRSLFTDFDPENIGVPKNLGMMGDSQALHHYFPYYYMTEFNPAGQEFTDAGVAGNPSIPEIMRPTLKGAMKAPTLRNVELTAPYMHNGVFRTLKEVVHFYNTRDVLGNCAIVQAPQPGVNCWPAPEIPANLALGVGNLQLTDAEENEIVAFLLTLTDTSLPSGLAAFDTNGNGLIDRPEAVDAVVRFFAGTVQRELATQVVVAFFNGTPV